MFDYSFDRHENCPYFSQNAWQMSENKYTCLKYDTENLHLYLFEIPPDCEKGFKEYLLPPPKEEPKTICKIYKFERKK